MGKKWSLIFILAVALCASASFTVFGATQVPVIVDVEVKEIQSLEFSSLPITLTVDHINLDWTKLEATPQQTTYNIVNNSTDVKIQVFLDVQSEIPEGLTLSVSLEEPNGAISLGPVVIDPDYAASDAVTDIGPVLEKDLVATFTLEATVEAGVVSLQAVEVVFAIVDQ